MTTSERDIGLMQSISESIEKKVHAYDEHRFLYLWRSILAGIFLTLPTGVGMVAWDIVSDGAPHIGKLFYATIFSFGVMIVIFLNGELANSNMMSFFVAAHRQWLSWPKALKILLTCTLMNLIGAMIAGFLFGHSSVASHFGPGSPLMDTMDGRLTKDVWTLFVDAILANMFANISVLGQMRMENEVARILWIMFITFSFVYAGFDQVVANYSLTFLAFFAGNSLNWGAVLTNWSVAWLGNLVGGGIVMGLGYSWVNEHGALYRD